jgi:hypothetical protein
MVYGLWFRFEGLAFEVWGFVKQLKLIGLPGAEVRVKIFKGLTNYPSD